MVAAIVIASVGVSPAEARTTRECWAGWGGPNGLTTTGVNSVNTKCPTAMRVFRKAKSRNYPYELYTDGRWWTRIENERGPRMSSWTYWAGGQRMVIIVKI